MSHARVEASVEIAALRLVSGNGGPIVGPLVLGGVRLWAAVVLDPAEIARRNEDGLGALTDPAALQSHLDNGRAPALRLAGCLVRERDPRRALQRASLLAAYTPRSVLVADGDDVLGVLVDAAVLDQGVIVHRPDDRLDVLAQPGPRVSTGGVDRRELALLESVYARLLDTDVGRGKAVTARP